MAIRISITTDTEMMELVDQYARDHGIDRNRAILELIESGFTKATGTTPVNLNQKRAFEEYTDLKLGLGSPLRSGLRIVPLQPSSDSLLPLHDDGGSTQAQGI